ncbi:MAG TPA: helix-turn-helix domain-containing protein, partial [Prolixibacteraceae bacterium]
IRNKYLAQMNVREKIAEVLLLLKETFGITLDSYLNMNLSRQEIADIAGTSVNRVTTQLNNFEDENLIVRTKR